VEDHHVGFTHLGRPGEGQRRNELLDEVCLVDTSVIKGKRSLGPRVPDWHNAEECPSLATGRIVAMPRPTRPKTVEQMVAEARERVQNLSVEEVADEIGEGNVLLVDLREDDERLLEGAIPDSMHVPRGMIELSADPTSPLHRLEFDPGRRMIVYCSTGSRSALAANTLQEMGYQNVAHIEGGMMAWKRANRDVETIGFG
jgi:rhodanese-related sulfurtransferase